jgi:lipopolysaccharide/colanic/teichoic acid biosynthesis glycosyltransferase
MPSSHQTSLKAWGHLALLFALVIYAPPLGLLGLLVLVLGGRPVIVVDTIALRDGGMAHSHRFRSIGQGTSAFHALGRWMRRTRLDELPALWSILHGDIRFADAWRYCWSRGPHQT